jgi:hypothetical protein
MLDETKSREYSDRRQTPTPVFSRYSLSGGRRRLVRRLEDKKKHLFVDLYSARLLIAIILLMCLSSLDAYLTLELIERGKVIEANPIMAYFLNIGIMPFTTIKFVVTATALIVLCVFKNVPVTRISLPVAIKIYMGVIAYECYLFMI